MNWKTLRRNLSFNAENKIGNHHGVEISVIWLVERSAIKLWILHVTREK